MMNAATEMACWNLGVHPSLVGCCVGGVLTDPALASLDLKIHGLTDTIGAAPAPTTRAAAEVLLASDSLLIRWSQFFELHKDDIFADPTVRGEFDKFTREYNALLQSWKSIGGATSETPAGEIPIDIHAPGGANLLGDLKWIALVGAGIYVLAVSGVLPAIVKKL